MPVGETFRMTQGPVVEQGISEVVQVINSPCSLLIFLAF